MCRVSYHAYNASKNKLRTSPSRPIFFLFFFLRRALLGPTLSSIPRMHPQRYKNPSTAIHRPERSKILNKSREEHTSSVAPATDQTYKPLAKKLTSTITLSIVSRGCIWPVRCMQEKLVSVGQKITALSSTVIFVLGACFFE